MTSGPLSTIHKVVRKIRSEGGSDARQAIMPHDGGSSLGNVVLLTFDLNPFAEEGHSHIVWLYLQGVPYCRKIFLTVCHRLPLPPAEEGITHSEQGLG